MDLWSGYFVERFRWVLLIHFLQIKLYGYIALELYPCSVRILKDASQTVSKPLAILLNKSVQTGIYPLKLKHANII